MIITNSLLSFDNVINDKFHKHGAFREHLKCQTVSENLSDGYVLLTLQKSLVERKYCFSRIPRII